jgi:hypothetical protein
MATRIRRASSALSTQHSALSTQHSALSTDFNGGDKVSTGIGSEGGMPGTPVGLVKKLANIQTPTTTFRTHWLLNCSHVLSLIARVGLKDVNSAG